MLLWGEHWTCMKYVLFYLQAIELRGPYDVANLYPLFSWQIPRNWVLWFMCCENYTHSPTWHWYIRHSGQHNFYDRWERKWKATSVLSLSCVCTVLVCPWQRPSGQLFGLSASQSKDAVCKSCRAVFMHAGMFTYGQCCVCMLVHTLPVLCLCLLAFLTLQHWWNFTSCLCIVFSFSTIRMLLGKSNKIEGTTVHFLRFVW